MPAFLSTTAPTLQWADSTFDLPLIREYVVSVDDVTAPASSTTVNVPAPAVPVGFVTTPLNLTNGHVYNIRVRARNSTLTTCGFPPIPCLSTSTSPNSATVTTRVDTTPPDTGTVTINGGAAFTNIPAVSLAVASSDPPSDGKPSSGVGSVQVSNTATFSCGLFSGPNCPVAVAPTVPGTLADGPDGPRTMFVKFRDTARPASNVCHSLFCVLLLGTTGNQSAVAATDTIVLDTLKPTVNLVQSALTVPAGLPISFDTVGSTDGVGGPNDSGVDPASFRYEFGDGTSATGATVTHPYMSKGTFTGTASVKDVAGNTATRSFSVVVGDPIVGTLLKVGKYRVKKVNRFNITTTGPIPFEVRVKRGSTLVRAFTVNGGPGTVTIRFTPKRRGKHTIRVTGGGVTRTASVIVTR